MGVTYDDVKEVPTTPLNRNIGNTFADDIYRSLANGLTIVTYWRQKCFVYNKEKVQIKASIEWRNLTLRFVFLEKQRNKNLIPPLGIEATTIPFRHTLLCYTTTIILTFLTF